MLRFGLQLRIAFRVKVRLALLFALALGLNRALMADMHAGLSNSSTVKRNFTRTASCQ